MKKKTLLLALIVTLCSLTGCKVSNSPELDGTNSGTGTSVNDSAAPDGGKTSDNSTSDSNTQYTAENTQSTAESDPQSAAESSDGETNSDSVTFDGFKISIDTERTMNVFTIDNQFSELNGRKVYAVPMTIENMGSETKGINMFYVKPFGPSGMELDAVYAYFTEARDFYKEMRPGAKMNAAYYILDDGSGEYCVVFQSFTEEKELKFNLG